MNESCTGSEGDAKRPGNWDVVTEGILADYNAKFAESDISTIDVDTATFAFDHRRDRVVLAYAISTIPLTKRDAGRIRGFPNVNVSSHRVMGERAFIADKGHFLGHASGGILDINLFPQRRELNRGWSTEGKLYRRMEHYVAQHPGVFFYHRPLYDDDEWIPESLQYAIWLDGERWWRETFRNK